MPDEKPPQSQQVPNNDDDAHADKTLEEKKRLGASGLSWDETEPKPGESFNRVTDMGEAD